MEHCTPEQKVKVSFRPKNASAWEYFVLPQGPVTVRIIASQPAFTPNPGELYEVTWGFITPFDNLEETLNAYGTNVFSTKYQIFPVNTPYLELVDDRADAGQIYYKIYYPEAGSGWESLPDIYSPVFEPGTGQPRAPYGFKILTIRDVFTDGRVLYDLLSPGSGSDERLEILYQGNLVFSRDFPNGVETRVTCGDDCQDDEIKIWVNRSSDLFMCCKCCSK